MKFEDFGAILKGKSDSAATTLESEKMKASVKWLNFSQKKWVLYCTKVETKHSFRNVKFLLLPWNEENDKIYREALTTADKWSQNTLGGETDKFTCLEARATSSESPFVLVDEEEEVDCLAFGLYSESKTKSKRYRIQVSEMIFLCDQVYNMNNIALEGEFICGNQNGQAKRGTG